MKAKKIRCLPRNKNCFNLIRFSFLLLLTILFCISITSCNLPDQMPGSEVESTVPEHGEVDVSSDTDISITFTKPALSHSVSLGFNPYFEYEESWSADNTTIVITASDDLLESTTYLITIAAVTFNDNSTLTQPVSFSFDTVVDENNPPAPLAMSEENMETVEDINDNIDNLIMKDKDSETVCAQIIEMLEDNENVAASGVDEKNNAVWVDFNDGETQIFQVITDDDEEYENITNNTFDAKKIKNHPGRPARTNNRSRLDESDEIPHYMPANNKALLANTLQTIHTDAYVNSSAATVKEMLTDRGYDVTMHPLTLDDFKHLDDYGIILLETHGTWRPTAAFNAIIDTLSSQYVLLTTTRITGENYSPDKYDIFNDRTSLVSWTVKNRVMTVSGVKIVSTIRNYGVTAEYVREQVKGKFTDKTVFFLNGCSGYSSDIVPGQSVSTFKDLLFEKCDKGPVFIGWNGRTSFLHAIYAALNLFQYSTASNRDLQVFAKDKKSKKMVSINLLTPLVVPWGGYNMTVQGAYHELKTTDVIKDKKFGGMLQMETKGTDTYENILMPHPRYVEFNAEGNHLIDMLADTSPEVTVGDSKCTVTRKAQDSCFWDIKMPAGAYGKLVVTENGRTSIPRTVYKWNPRITIQSDYMNLDGKKQTQVNLSLHGRATLDSSSLRDYPGDEMPTAGFITEWEKSASTISWSTEGDFTTVDPYFGGISTSKWSDSGLRYFGSRDFGQMNYSENVGLDIDCDVVIPYTVTQIAAGRTFTADSEEDIFFYKFYSLSGVTSDWTVTAQTFDILEDWPSGIDTASEIVSWGAFSPDPLFDSSTEPR